MSYETETTAANTGLVRLREYVRRDKPKKLRDGFKFEKPLDHGWLLRYLFALEDMTWHRWDHWAKMKEAGQLIDEPIPEISFGRDDIGRKAWEKALSAVTRNNDWAGWSSWQYFDYCLDWLLFGFGHQSQKEEPKPPGGCEGASERLYQIFNLEPLLAFPHDYLGDILAENNFGRRSGFYPTPMEICTVMAKMTVGDEPEERKELRTKTVCDPALGTGRMLLCWSNYSYRLYGVDINATVIKACLVNGYLYAPWLVKAFDFLEREPAGAPALEAVERAGKLITQLELIPV